MIIDLTTTLFLILLFVGSLLALIIKKAKKISTKYWVIFTFIVYILCLAKITIFPIYIFDQETLQRAKEGITDYIIYYQLIPFHSIQNYLITNAYIQIIGNLVLLAPLVVYIEIFFHSRLSYMREILVAFVCSLLIETIQLIINICTEFPSRVADIDDLILNTIGSIVMICIVYFIKKIITKKPKLMNNLLCCLYNK